MEVYTRISTTFNLLYTFIEPYIITGIAFLHTNALSIAYGLVALLCLYLTYMFITKTPSSTKVKPSTTPIIGVDTADNNTQAAINALRLELYQVKLNQQHDRDKLESNTKQLMEYAINEHDPHGDIICVNSQASQYTYYSNSPSLLKFMNFSIDGDTFQLHSFQVPADAERLSIEYKEFDSSPYMINPIWITNLVDKILSKLPSNQSHCGLVTTKVLDPNQTCGELVSAEVYGIKDYLGNNHYDESTIKNIIRKLLHDIQKLISNTALMPIEPSRVRYLHSELSGYASAIASNEFNWETVRNLITTLTNHVAECSEGTAEYDHKVAMYAQTSLHTSALNDSLGALDICSAEEIFSNFGGQHQNQSPLIKLLNHAYNIGTCDDLETSFELNLSSVSNDGK